MSILGIDLGTTNSLIAYYTDDEARIIPNRLGENLTPSVVSLDDGGEIYVGRIAAERLVTHPQMTASAFKRNMGSEKKFMLGGKSFLPEELSSFVVRSLLEDAEVYLGSRPEEVVISVPAYFNDMQRKATKRAGELAGVKVERLINEPTAAAIAYGLRENSNSTFLIIDLGGGTFDVSILELSGNIMEVRGVAGDNYLGGEDFTDALGAMFIQECGLDADNFSLKDFAMVHSQAELCKRNIQGTDILMKCKIDGKERAATISKTDYEDACAPLLARLRRPIERALGDATAKLSDIDDIIMVGGATKQQLVKRFIGKLFKKFPSANINPEEVVALGAAIQAALKERNALIGEIVLTDVCPYTLGTNISIIRDDGRVESGHYLPIIERNTVIPASRTERLWTLHDNQRNVTVEVLQGESRFAGNNITLGQINIPIPPAPKGSECVDVRYTYDINGILEVDVDVVSTGLKKRMVLEQNPGYMSGEEVERRLKELEKIKIHPREQEKNKLLLSRAERMYEENIGDVRRHVGECLQSFEDALDRQDPQRAKQAAELLKKELDAIENDLLFD